VLNDPRVSLAAPAPAAAADRVLDALDQVRPIVRLNVHDPVAARAGAALLSMLSRLFAHTIADGNAALGRNPWGVSTFAELGTALDPIRPAPVCAHQTDFVVAIGNCGRSDLWVGGDDWTAVLDREPVPMRAQTLGVGLQAAAALAVGEVLKPVLAGLGLSTVSAQRGIVWNLLDYRCQPANAPVVGSPNRPTLAILGCGSVGTSFAAILSCEEAVSGSCSAVDGDSFDPSRNPFRYPALLGAESSSKARWVADLLTNAGWEAKGENTSVGQWVLSRVEPGFDGIAVASVDDRSGRMQVADLLADTTLSVGVAGLAMHLQREHLGDEYACPFCEYVSLRPPSTQAGVYATATGLEIPRVLQLVDGAPLSGEDVAVAVRAGHLRPDRAEGMVGRRLADLVRESYAEATVAPEGQALRVAAPHVSWLAGLLPAVEVIKSAYRLPLISRRVDVDLAGLPTGFVRAIAADTSGRCLCASPWRRRWMRRPSGS
jgi:hypothetical protein